MIHLWGFLSHSLFVRLIPSGAFKGWWAVATLRSVDPVHIRSVWLCNLVVAISYDNMVT